MARCWGPFPALASILQVNKIKQNEAQKAREQQSHSDNAAIYSPGLAGRPPSVHSWKLLQEGSNTKHRHPHLLDF